MLLFPDECRHENKHFNNFSPDDFFNEKTEEMYLVDDVILAVSFSVSHKVMLSNQCNNVSSNIETDLTVFVVYYM